jgi:diguanylate cyclase (GGDEF)-like protein
MAHWLTPEKLAALSGQQRHQAKMIHVLLIIMGVYFAALGAMNTFMFNDLDLAILDFSGMVGTLVLLAYFRRSANLKVTSWAVVLILTAIILIFIHITSGLAYSIIWVTVLPPISFFLLGRLSGAWVCAGVFIYVVAFFSMQLPNAQPTVPELSSLMNIAEVLLAHWFLFRFYERSRADAYAELERLSETDKLTGLYNRRHLDMLLTQEFNMHKRTEAPLSLILCDIDHFKRINDKNGHLTGDSILQEIGSTLRATMRGTDMCGRWGGEEFLIICPNTSLEGAVVIIAKLQDALNQQHFAKDIKVTLSFGVATSNDDKDAEQQLRRADDALYEAKRRGRDCYVVAD